MDKQQNIKNFLQDLHRVQGNAVYFLEKYWNIVNPDRKLELTDEEKEQIFKDNRCKIPFVRDLSDLRGIGETIEEKRKKGLKDWEIF